MNYFIPLTNSTTLKSFKLTTLILPQPSISSLPQLSVDLIIHNLKLNLIGYLGLEDFIPCVSGLDSLSNNTSTSSEGISFSVEVYQTKSGAHTFVLPRSPVIKARKQNYLESLKAFVIAAEFNQVLLIAGIDAAARGDESLRETNPLRYFILPSTSTSNLPLSTSLKTKLPSYTLPSSEIETLPLFPHGGLTRSILESFNSPTSTSSDPPVEISALLIYVAEGDNTTLAYYLADAIVDLLDLEAGGGGGGGKREWIDPKSWEAGLRGPELGRARGGEMFG